MSYWKIVSLICVGIIISGCKSTLSRKPYDSLELHWIKHLKKAYPNWRPPIKPPNLTLAGNEQTFVEEPTPTYQETVAPQEIETVPIMPPDIIMEEVDAQPEVTPKRETHLAKTQEQTYTIQKGDTLSEISAELYGTGKWWKKIAEANPEAIKNPNKLKVGTIIVIPPK